ncbi:SIS domain-containing protein [Kyrpidia tusciae]|uniref:Phosphoheptose isomerase n=1 Tax=Kyrpidia tusciae (strain DSM 2912 / NBRC 15312 / T2) TaxID=562970 RepID=D5WTD6_KYRT2|nr:SIS domain-containing protein [Kyrpidia tusciae]ADG07172.1 phosphoheptose isomerase [Kyrpidia tusciae DSM 2912]
MDPVERWAKERFQYRNDVSARFFPREAGRLAAACREMAERFLDGGRLIAIGRGPYATDAQHVSVEFVHPVIVGKRALPALDLSMAFPEWLNSVLRPEDMVMGFGAPGGDPAVAEALARARAGGAQTFALPGTEGSYAVDAPDSDPFVHQELIEILYHTLWETVHVFFEHRELGSGAGEAEFLYPFLGSRRQDTSKVVAEVAESIEAKAREVERLRMQVAAEEMSNVVRAVHTLADCLAKGGKLIVFGNGGSATDANDWALDMVLPPAGMRPHPAVSLSMEPAVLSALANDVGAEVMFVRQLIAHANREDVAVGISTSGGSKNILSALEEAKKRGLVTMALLGYDGGEVMRRGLADIAVIVRSDYIPRIQEVQASVYHIIREGLEVVGNDA